MSIITIIDTLFPIVEKLGGTIANWIKAAKEAGELTPEKEAEYQARLDQVFSADYAKVRPVPLSRDQDRTA